MTGYVSKEQLEEFFKGIEITVAGRTRAEAISEVLKAVYNGIMKLPTVDAVPVRHGKWIKGTKEMLRKYGYYERSDVKFCSECKHEAYWDTDDGQQLFDYCPYCGARMDAK